MEKLQFASPEGLARLSAGRPKTVIVAWAAVLAVSIALIASLFGDALTTQFSPTNDPDSKRAKTLIEERLRGQETVAETVIVRSTQFTVDDRAFRSRVESLRGEIVALGPDVVAGAFSYYETGDEAFVSEDRRSTVIALTMSGEIRDAERNIDGVYEAVDRAGAADGFEVLITGETTFAVDFAEQGQRDIERGELFGMPLALLILAVVFGALGAAVLPMALAVMAIVISLGVAVLVGQVYDLHVFTQNVATMIGLAVGIDYSLFIVSRFREERARGLEKVDAIAAAGATASRAVLVSGLTVVIALLGMLIVPFTAFFSVGLGTILVVIAAVAASLTLLPAVLSLMGDRVNRFRVPFIGRGFGAAGSTGGVWDRISYAVMRRPWLSLALAGGLLVPMAAPLFSINTGTSGVSTFPDGLRAKECFVALQQDFGFGADAPANVVIEGDIASAPVAGAIAELRGALAADTAFGPSSLEVSESGGIALLSAPVVGDPTSAAAVSAVERLRESLVVEAFERVPATVVVGGRTAENIDFVDIATRYIPIVFGLVLGLSLLLLTVVFRSIVVPLKAIALNLLSVGATYGMLMLVFQHGVGAGLLGFEQAPVIQAWIPLFLFAILFGLSMDYHVFLLSRIRERY